MFRFWHVCCHRYVILDLPAKFRNNRTIVGKVMTSYRFFKMAAIESEIYFRVGGLRWYLFIRWKCICMPNFDEISQSTAEIKLLPVFGKRTAVILEFYFRFRFRPLHNYQHAILDLPPNFVIIGRSAAELWHIDFSDGGHRVGNVLPVSGLVAVAV